jgi:hypothetical protein
MWAAFEPVDVIAIDGNVGETDALPGNDVCRDR